MKINVIGERTKDISTLRNYSTVVSYYWEAIVIPELNKHYDVKFYDASEIDSARDCDKTFLICPHAITTGLDLKPQKRFGTTYRLRDEFTCISPTGAPDKRYNITYGVDREYMIPDQSPFPTILLQEFVNSKGDNKARSIAIEAIAEIKKTVDDVFVYSMFVDSPVVDLKIVNSKREYIKWVDILKYYRKSWCTVDLTPFRFELSKLEAAACGCKIFAPIGLKRRHPLGEVNIINQSTFQTEEFLGDNLYYLLLDYLSEWTYNKSNELHNNVCEYFTWERVANKVINFLNGEK